MQLKDHVADRVSQIDANKAALGLGRGRECLHVKELPRVELHAGQQEHGHRRAMLFNKSKNIFVPKTVFAVTRGQLHKRGGRVEPLELDHRLEGVEVRRERLGLDHYLVPLLVV